MRHTIFPLIFLLSGCSTVSKAYWDHKIVELCKENGGITVYEKAELNKKTHPSFISSHGVILLKDKSHMSAEDPFYILYKENVVLNEPDPYVFKTEYSIYRTLDDKEFGKLITYSRRGGDFPVGISHPSHFSCNNIENFQGNLSKAIFTIVDK